MERRNLRVEMLLNENEHEVIRQLAREEGLPMSVLMRRLLLLEARQRATKRTGQRMEETA